MIVEITKLKINPIHSKLYLTNDIDDLADSIKELGQLEKIIVNNDFLIISGVRRYYALKKLNHTTADVEIKNFNQGDIRTLISYNKQRVKTNREILNEAKYLKSLWGQKRGRKPANDNVIQLHPNKVDTRKKIADATGVKPTNLTKLEYIDRKAPELLDDIDKGKFSVNQIYDGLRTKEKKKKSRSDQSVTPTIIDNEYYKIINKSSDDLSDLADESITTIFTSPPYWNKRKYSEDTEELGSEKTVDEFVQRMANHLHCSYRVLKNEGSFFLNIGDTFYEKCLQSVPHKIVIELVKKGWILRNTIVWKKTNTMPSTVKDNLTPSYEFIFHLVKSKNYYYNALELPLQSKSKIQSKLVIKKGKDGETVDLKNIGLSGIGDSKKLEDFWTEDIVTTATANQHSVKKYGGSDHPAPFPVEISIMPILQSSRPGDTVMDLFSGSATTGEVALKLGRKYVGYEFMPKHNEVQKNRLDDAVNTYNQYSQISQAA